MRLRWGIAASVAFAIVWPAGASRAADAPYLNWPGLLPPLGSPRTPDVEPECADGADACIDRTIAEMYRRLNAVVPQCGHNAVFSLAYLRVTEDVRKAIRSGFFTDRRWLNHQDAVFAALYFNAYDDYVAGRRDRIPKAWLLAFDAAAQHRVSALGNFLLAMNAHINRDFPYVLAGVGLTKPDGTSHKPDHNRYNRRLLELYKPVLAEVARRFDPGAEDLDAGRTPVDDLAVEMLLQSWREATWRDAERLIAARTPEERKQVSDSIEEGSALGARLIIAMFGYGPGQSSAARDAYCALHGGQERRAGTPRLLVPRRGVALDRRDGVTLRLACPTGMSACRGTVELARGGRRLGNADFFLMPAASQRMRIALTRSAAAAIRRRRSASALVVVRRTGIPGATSRPLRVRV